MKLRRRGQVVCIMAQIAHIYFYRWGQPMAFGEIMELKGIFDFLSSSNAAQVYDIPKPLQIS